MKLVQSVKEKTNIGKNIRAIRVRNKLSQRETVDQLELMGISISRSMLSQIEMGIRNVEVLVLLGLSELFHVGMDEFFEGMSVKAALSETD